MHVYMYMCYMQINPNFILELIIKVTYFYTSYN